jgi:hypothetical protein
MPFLLLSGSSRTVFDSVDFNPGYLGSTVQCDGPCGGVDAVPGWQQDPSTGQVADHLAVLVTGRGARLVAEPAGGSTVKNTTSKITPAAMLAQMAGLLQPHRADCWSPNTISPTPATISARPR